MIAHAIDLNFPSPFAEVITALGTVTQFDVADGMALECFNPWFANYHVKVVVSSTIPFLILLLIWFVHFLPTTFVHLLRTTHNRQPLAIPFNTNTTQ